MRWRLNDTDYELAPGRIKNVSELTSRMARGALLYWTMLPPAHAVLLDPATRTVSQLAFFRPLWGLQRSNQIRHDRHEGSYQVLVSTAPAAAGMTDPGSRVTHGGPDQASVCIETPQFEPRI